VNVGAVFDMDLAMGGSLFSLLTDPKHISQERDPKKIVPAKMNEHFFTQGVEVLKDHRRFPYWPINQLLGLLYDLVHNRVVLTTMGIGKKPINTLRFYFEIAGNTGDPVHQVDLGVIMIPHNWYVPGPACSSRESLSELRSHVLAWHVPVERSARTPVPGVFIGHCGRGGGRRCGPPPRHFLFRIDGRQGVGVGLFRPDARGALHPVEGRPVDVLLGRGPARRHRGAVAEPPQHPVEQALVDGLEVFEEGLHTAM
jgi:hypothetical protein